MTKTAPEQKRKTNHRARTHGGLRHATWLPRTAPVGGRDGAHDARRGHAVSGPPGDSRKTDLIPFDKLEAFFTENLAPGVRVGEALAASAA